MRKMFLILAMLITALFAFTACEPAANTYTANKTANMANNSANTMTPVNTAAVEADLKKMVADTATALAKNDVEALDKMYADTYMLVNLDGSVQSKADRLASFRSGDTKFESFVYDEVNVRTNPEGTGAVVVSRAMAMGTNKGKPIASQVRVTQVWSKMKDGWKQVSGHATEITGAATSAMPANTANANKPAMSNMTNANR